MNLSIFCSWQVKGKSILATTTTHSGLVQFSTCMLFETCQCQFVSLSPTNFGSFSTPEAKDGFFLNLSLCRSHCQSSLNLLYSSLSFLRMHFGWGSRTHTTTNYCVCWMLHTGERIQRERIQKWMQGKGRKAFKTALFSVLRCRPVVSSPSPFLMAMVTSAVWEQKQKALLNQTLSHKQHCANEGKHSLHACEVDSHLSIHCSGVRIVLISNSIHVCIQFTTHLPPHTYTCVRHLPVHLPAWASSSVRHCRLISGSFQSNHRQFHDHRFEYSASQNSLHCFLFLLPHRNAFPLRHSLQSASFRDNDRCINSDCVVYNPFVRPIGWRVCWPMNGFHESVIITSTLISTFF